MRPMRVHLQSRRGEIVYVDYPVWFGQEKQWVLFDERQASPIILMRQDILTTTPGSTFSYTSKSDWDNTSSSVICIGAGARGAIGASSSTSGGGGGGGACTEVITNGANAGFQFATPGTTAATCEVGARGATNGAAGGDTWVNDTAYPTTGTNKVGAKGGAALGSSSTATGGSGGASGSAYTSGFTNPVVFSGGNGANSGGTATTAGGGGGGGGIFGVGNNGSSTSGGSGDAGKGGAAGAPGGNGTSGNEISGGVGGGGGGGGATVSGGTGGAGGNYGAGSGGGSITTGSGGIPATGVIVFTWPVYALVPLFKSEVMQQVLSQ